MLALRETRGCRGAMGESVLSAGFAATNGELSCDGVSLESIARSVGTPAYVYSAALIREQYGRLAPHRTIKVRLVERLV